MMKRYIRRKTSKIQPLFYCCDSVKSAPLFYCCDSVKSALFYSI